MADIEFLRGTATVTNGSTTVQITGATGAFVSAGTALFIEDAPNVVEAISGDASTITLRQPWPYDTGTFDFRAFNTLEGLASAIRRLRQLTEDSVGISTAFTDIITSTEESITIELSTGQIQVTPFGYLEQQGTQLIAVLQDAADLFDQLEIDVQNLTQDVAQQQSIVDANLQASNDARDAAEGFATDSDLSAQASAQSAQNASDSASAALTSEQNAASSESQSSTSATLSQRWANEDFDVIVEGAEYSSKHYSIVSGNFADAAEQAASTAASDTASQLNATFEGLVSDAQGFANDSQQSATSSEQSYQDALLVQTNVVSIEQNVTQLEQDANTSATASEQSNQESQTARDESVAARVLAETYRDEAEDFSEIASAWANGQGYWDALTGALNVPASVRHNGAYWLLMRDLADVTLSEPSSENDDWQPLSEELSINWDSVQNKPDSDGIPEGATNLYYTDERAVSAVEATDDWNSFIAERERERAKADSTMYADFKRKEYRLFDDDVIGTTDKFLEQVMTVSRTSAGWTFSKRGQLVEVPPNTPRYYYNPATGEAEGILIEEQRTNFATNNNDLTQWTAYTGTEVEIADQLFGNYNFFKVSKTTNTINSGVYVSSENITVGTNLSTYVKAGTSNDFVIRYQDGAIRMRAEIVGESINFLSVVGFSDTGFEYLGGGIFRVFGTLTEDRAVKRFILNPVGATDLSVTGSCFFGLPQAEQGIKPSSPIITNGTAVTRTTDNVARTLGVEFNPSEGTFVVEWERSKDIAEIGILFNAGFGSGTIRMPEVIYLADGGMLIGFFSSTQVIPEPLLLEKNKLKISYDSVKGRCGYELNNGDMATFSFTGDSSLINNLALGHRRGTSDRVLNGTISKFVYKPVAELPL